MIDRSRVRFFRSLDSLIGFLRFAYDRRRFTDESCVYGSNEPTRFFKRFLPKMVFYSSSDLTRAAVSWRDSHPNNGLIQTAVPLEKRLASRLNGDWIIRNAKKWIPSDGNYQFRFNRLKTIKKWSYPNDSGVLHEQWAQHRPGALNTSPPLINSNEFNSQKHIFC